VSITASEWALRQDLGPVPKFVLVVLADAANDQNVCWPRISTIAKRAGVSPRTVQRAIKYLVQRKLVTVEQRYRDDGSNSSNLYRLTLEGGVNLSRQDDNLTPPPDTPVIPPCHLCQGEGDTGVTPLTTRRTLREPPLPQAAKAEIKPELPDCGGGDISGLYYPRDLLPLERSRAEVMIGALDPPVNQQVLDEWAGIISAGGIRASPLGCLRALIKRAQEGKFMPERGLRIAQARQAKQWAEAQVTKLPELVPADQSRLLVRRMLQVAQRQGKG